MLTISTGSDAKSVNNFYMNISAHNGGEITPPTSFHNPSNEKQTRDILQQVEEHKSRKTGQTILKVNSRVWITVGSILTQNDKLRLNYFPLIERLVLRVPSDMHEMFLRRLNRCITDQLHLLSQGSGSAADFAKDIHDAGSATIISQDSEYEIHDPDNSFRHSDSPLAIVIIEMIYSQEGKNLRRLAEEYIFGSKYMIRVVIGVDIEYKKYKRATFSIWRAAKEGSVNDKEVWVIIPTVANQTFRHDDGTPNLDQDAGLRLRLEDFADQETSRQFKDIDRDIFVSCNELYRYLEVAETVAKKDAKSIVPTSNSRVAKRHRSETPEEQLNDCDEKAYNEAEERISKRQELDDSSYEGRSSESSQAGEGRG